MNYHAWATECEILAQPVGVAGELRIVPCICRVKAVDLLSELVMVLTKSARSDVANKRNEYGQGRWSMFFCRLPGINSPQIHPLQLGLSL